MLPQYLTLISIPLGLVGSILYIRDMYRGTAKPNRVSFFLWSLAPMIGVAIAYGEGTRWSLIPVITGVIVHLIITVVFAAMAVDVESIVLLGINVHISLNQR